MRCGVNIPHYQRLARTEIPKKIKGTEMIKNKSQLKKEARRLLHKEVLTSNEKQWLIKELFKYHHDWNKHTPIIDVKVEYTYNPKWKGSSRGFHLKGRNGWWNPSFNKAVDDRFELIKAHIIEGIGDGISTVEEAEGIEGAQND